MSDATKKTVEKTVEFLKSIGHNVSAEELKTLSSPKAEWTHKFVFIGN